MQLKLRRILAYSLPALGPAMVIGPIAVILPSLYAKHAAVSLAAIGTLFMLARIFDAITDPLIGYLSDRTETRFGARKPWIVVGGALISISVWFLFQIPADATIFYFGFWSLLYYLGQTMFHVPHVAWGSELSTNYVARSRVFAVRGVVDASGGLVYTLLPMLLLYIGLSETSEFSPQMIGVLGVILVLTIPATIAVGCRYAPRGELVESRHTSVGDMLSSIKNNKLLLRFLTAYLLSGAGTGFFGALLFPFFDSYLGIGDKIPTILIAVYLVGLLSIPIWQFVTVRIGKHRAWGLGWALASLSLMPMFWLEPGSNVFLLPLLCMMGYGFFNGVSTLAPYALLGDVIDYELMKTGADRAGNYYSLLMLVGKTAGSFGGFAFVLLGAVFGYELGSDNSGFANAGMAAMFCLVPGFMQLLAVPLIWTFPLTRSRHDIVVRKLTRQGRIKATGAEH